VTTPVLPKTPSPVTMAAAAPTKQRQQWLARVAAIEPLWLLLLAPLLWFPRHWSGWLLLAIPLLWSIRWLARGRLSVRTPYDVTLGVLVLTIPLTLLPIVDWDAAAPKLYGLILGIALVYALANSLRSGTLTLLGVYTLVVGCGCGVAVVGLIGSDWKGGRSPVLDAISERLPRVIQGVTKYGSRGAIHPNEIAGALTLLQPLAVACALGVWRDRMAQRRTALLWALVPSSVLMLLVLILTASRSAFLGVAGGLLLVLAWALVGGQRSPRGRVRGVLVLVVSVAALGLASRYLISAWVGDAESGLDSYQSRVELWNRALRMLWDFPFTGIGPGQFSLVLHALYVPFLVAPNEYVPHAHNVFLQLGLDLGIPGALAMLGALGGFLWAMWQVCRRSCDLQLAGAAVGLAAGVVSFLVYGLTDAIVIGARGGVLLWIMLGLGAALWRVPARR
jgi:putative inorganic carbon (HCO3(-)) transporter